MKEDAYCPGCGVIGENEPCKKDCERTKEAQLKQPYTYTLPQHFILDKEVPARWRVWAVINGFFIGGQYCWASNDWIAEKIGTHKDTVSQAVLELEKLGIVRCERGARSRKIYPMIGANAYQWSASTPIKTPNDRHQRLSISYRGNSESNSLGVANAPQVFTIEREEGDTRPKSKPKYPNAKTVFSWFPKPERSWEINTTELKHGELLFSRGEKAVRGALAFHRNHLDHPDALKIVKPSQLEGKWEDLKDFAKRNGL